MVLGFWDIAVPIVGAPDGRRPEHPGVGRGGVQRWRAWFRRRRLSERGPARRRYRAARAATTGPIGANLFVPQPSNRLGAAEYYADEPSKRSPSTTTGQPVYGDDDWVRKLEVVADVRPRWCRSLRRRRRMSCSG